MPKTIGDCIRSAAPFQMGLLFENMQVLITFVKYQTLASDKYAGLSILCGNEKLELPSSKDVTPQMLFKLPSEGNIAEQALWSAALAPFMCFIDWWMSQPVPNDGYRDDDDIAWYDAESIIGMWNTFILEEE